MTLPKHPFIRRQELLDWLTDQGFTTSDVRKWISEGVIPQRRFATAKHTASKSSPRAYYHVPDVAEALKIANPLSK